MDEEARILQGLIKATESLRLDTYSQELEKLIKPIVTPTAWMEVPVRAAALGDFDRHTRALSSCCDLLSPTCRKRQSCRGCWPPVRDFKTR